VGVVTGGLCGRGGLGVLTVGGGGFGAVTVGGGGFGAVTVGGGGFGAVVVGTVVVGTVVVGTVTVGVVVVTTGPVCVTTGEVSVTPPPPGVVVTVVPVVSVTGAVAVVSVVSVSVTVVTTPAAKPDAAHTPRISSAINATAARVPRKFMGDILPRWSTDMPRLGDIFIGFCGNRHENGVAGTSQALRTESVRGALAAHAVLTRTSSTMSQACGTRSVRLTRLAGP
jgi:hypothetical protein